MAVMIVLAAFGAAVIWDFVPLIRHGEKRDAVVCGAVLGIAFILSMLYAFGIPLPTFYGY